MRLANLLQWVWADCVFPYWPRRRRILEADILARSTRLSYGGWTAALDGLRPGTRWLGNGLLVALTGLGLGSVGRHLKTCSTRVSSSVAGPGGPCSTVGRNPVTPW